MPCTHINYTIERAFIKPFKIIRELSNFELRPLSFSGVCTQECKDKMKMIYQIAFGCCIRLINDFFDDALILTPSQRNISILDYESYFLPYPWCKEPNFVSRVESRFNVAYINGLPTRLITLEQQQQFQETKLLQLLQLQPYHEQIFPQLNQYQIQRALQCRHIDYTIENAINQGYRLIEYNKRILDIEFWPLSFSGQCTQECKNKMKMIYQIVFNDFIIKINNFFDDVLIIPGAENNVYFSEYNDYFNPLPDQGPLFIQRVESRFNVGNVNGIPSRLIPLQQQQQNQN